MRAQWRHVGGTSVEAALCSPATGAVVGVWFGSGGILYARTRSGRVFQTLDFESWTPAAAQPAPAMIPAGGARLPETGAKVVAAPDGRGALFALGRNLFRSDDGGRSWTNLTAWRTGSVVGSGQHSLAESPVNPDQIVLGNDYGVWRSTDGGLSWTGLNEALPNLTVRRIVSTPAGTSGMIAVADGFGALELPAGGSVWQPAAGDPLERENAYKRQFSVALNAQVTAVAQSGDVFYAGSSDGRLWSSFDAGRTWRESPAASRADGAVERIFVDSAEPRVALAAVGGTTGARVLRTTNAGTFWDDISSNLPEGAAHAVVAERSAGAVYAATDKGVFFARADLENAGPQTVSWVPLTANIAGPAMDVKLDPAGNQLYAAMDGFGIYAAPAPHRASVLRIVNAADYSNRAAAPGSLLSVLGGRVASARGAGADYPVLAASDTESQIQVPFEATGPAVSLALQTSRGAVTLGLPVQSVSPAIFVSREDVPMLLDADSGLLLDGHATARSGSRIQVLATGFGKVSPDWPTGLAAPLDNPPTVAASVKAYLDRVPVQVTRATLAPGYVGFYLIEIQLPAIVNAGQAELYLTADGQESNRVSIALEP